MRCILHRWRYDFKGRMNSLNMCVWVLRTCRKCGLHQFRQWHTFVNDDLGPGVPESNYNYASISEGDYEQLLKKYIKEGKEFGENLKKCLSVGW